MSISKDRLGFEKISSLTQTDFNTKKDVTGALTTSSNKSTSSAVASKPSVLDKPKIDTTSNADKVKGNFGPQDCSIDLSLPKFKKIEFGNINTDFDLGIDIGDINNYTICGTSTKDVKGNVDNLLRNIKKTDDGYNILDSTREGKLDSTIDDIVDDKIRSGNINDYMDPDKLNTNVKMGLNKVTGVTGVPIKSKLNLDTSLSVCNPGVNATGSIEQDSLLSRSVLTSMIETVSCLGPGYTVGFLEDVVEVNDGTRFTILKSLKDSMVKDSDPDVEKKLLIAKSIREIDDVPADDVSTRGSTDKILDNVSKSKSTSNSPVSDYINLTTSLDSVDPTWDKDDEGNINYYRSKNNDRLNYLAGSYVENNYTADQVYDGNVTTVVDRPVGILVANKFKEHA